MIPALRKGPVMRIAILLITMLVLSSCQTKPIASMSYTEQRALALKAVDKCTEQGFPPDHPEAMNCALQEMRADDYNRAMNRQRLKAFSEGLQRMGEQQQRAAALNRPIHCTSSTQGPFTNTNCY